MTRAVLCSFLVIFFQQYTSINSTETFIQMCSNKVDLALTLPKEFDVNGMSNLSFRIRDLIAKSWCDTGSPKEINLLKSNATKNGGQTGQGNSSLNITSDGSESEVKFDNGGGLRLGVDYYPPSQYCISKNTKNEIGFTICIPNCGPGTSNPCIKKCCKMASMINYNGRNCGTPSKSQEILQEWTPKFYNSPNTPDQNLRSISPHYSISPPSCEPVVDDDGNLEPGLFQFFTSFKLSAEDKGIAWKLGMDGQIWLNKPNWGWTKLKTNNYCVDGIFNFGENGTEQDTDQVLVLCPDDAPTGALRYSTMYVTLMFISSFFLLLTAVVYISLWDLQNVHGWTILSQVVSMFFMYISLATAHLYGIQHTSDDSGGVCAVIGVVAHYFFITSFCWLTLINFDLCYTFRSLNPSGTGRSKGLKRYWCYFIFSVIVPLTVIITALTLEHIYGDDLETEVILPHYGVALCYVAVSAQGVYIYSIVGTLLSVNMILISITAFTMFKLKSSTKSVIKNNSTSTNQSFWLFFKLFIVMGVTWIFEIISWADMNSHKTDKIRWYWLLFDIVNILQAVAIFLIFVCKKRILNQLKTKYPTVTRTVTNIFTGKICSRTCCKYSVTRDPEIEIQTAQTSLENHSKGSAEADSHH